MSIGERGQRTPFRLDDALHGPARGAVRDEFKILLGDSPCEDLHQDLLDDEVVRRDFPGHDGFAEPERGSR